MSAQIINALRIRAEVLDTEASAMEQRGITETPSLTTLADAMSGERSPHTRNADWCRFLADEFRSLAIAAEGYHNP